jgi:hypothetical protein
VKDGLTNEMSCYVINERIEIDVIFCNNLISRRNLTSFSSEIHKSKLGIVSDSCFTYA